MTSTVFARPSTFFVYSDDTLTVGASDGLLEDDYTIQTGLSSVEATSFSSPSHGSLSVSLDGSLTYVPDPGFTGVDTFTYYISDGASTAFAVATIDVIQPSLVAAPDVFVTGANSTLTLDSAHGLLANDLSTLGALNATSFSSPAHGSLNVSLDGSVTYVPDPDFVGTDTFSYYISNGHQTAWTTATIDVVDAPPVANNDAYTLRAGSTLTVDAAHGLLANDIDSGGTVDATSFSSPAHGSLSVSLDGSITYVPDYGFTGVDTFSYFISDGAQTAWAVATLDVVDKAPVAAADYYRVRENSTLIVGAAKGLLANDFDPDGDPITATSFSSTSHGSLSVSLDGSFTYAPAANYVGADSFTYYISDGSLTSSAVVTLEDGETAVIANPDTFDVYAGATLTVSAANGLLVNDYPSTAQRGLSVHATSFSSPAHGQLSVSLDGSVTYVPNAGFVGTDTFTYYISDGVSTASAVAAIDVIQPSLVAAPDTFVTKANGSLTVNAADGLLANDLSTAGSLQAMSFSSPAHGSLSVSLDGSLTYVPDADFVGTDTFSYYISNGYQTAWTTATIDVIDAPPIANNNSYTLRPGRTLTVDAAHGLLANDVDPGGTVHATSFSSPAHGSLSVSLDGSLTYVPDYGFTGVDTFSYFISDGAQTAWAVATLDVVDKAPVAADDHFHAASNGQLIVGAAKGLLANDFDPDGDPITATSFSSAAHGSLSVSLDGSVTYTPDANYVGTDSFSYFITDGALTATATAYIDVVADPLVVATQSAYVLGGNSASRTAAAGALYGDSGIGAMSVASIVGGTVGGATSGAYGYLILNANGSFTYYANNAAAIAAAPVGLLTDTFTYVVKDAFGASATTHLNLLVVGPRVSVSELLSESRFIGLTAGYQVQVVDNASNILNNLSALSAELPQISSILSTDVVPSVDVADFTNWRTTLDKLVNGFVISDAASAVVGDLSTIDTDSHVAALSIASGAATLSGGVNINAPTFSLNGAGTALTLGENLNYAGVFTQGAGAKLIINAGDTLGCAGVLKENSGAITIATGGKLSLTGTGSLSSAVSGAGKLAILGGVTTLNAGATLSVANLAVNGPDATLALGTVGMLSYAGALDEVIGAISIASGDKFSLTGTDSLSGAVSGAGKLAIQGGVTTLNAGATLSVANLAVNGVGATLALGTVGMLTYAGSLAEGSGAISIASGDKFSLTGTDSLSSEVSGAGKLAIQGGVTTLNAGATLAVANLAVNGAGATLALGAVGMLNYVGSLAELNGAISIAAGNELSLTGTDMFAGAVSGAGELAIAGGGASILSGANLTVSNLAISGAATNVTLDENLNYAGAFSLLGGTLDLAAGQLELSGDDNLTGGAVNGSHLFITQGLAKTVSALTLGGTLDWENTTTVNQTGTVTIGDASGNAAVLDNTASGIYDFLGDTKLAEGTSTASYIANAGVIKKTGGTGISAIRPEVVNTGTLKAKTGTLELKGAITGTGLDSIAGVATMQFDSTVAAGQTVSFSGSGGTLDLAAPQGFSGAITGFDLGGNTNDALDIGASWTFTGATQGAASTTLSLVDGSAHAAVTLLGAYTGTFSHTAITGGTQITYSP